MTSPACVPHPLPLPAYAALCSSICWMERPDWEVNWPEDDACAFCMCVCAIKSWWAHKDIKV
jgi:hypothetical protein